MKFYKQIFLFNKPFFIAAALVTIVCISVLYFFSLPLVIDVIVSIVLAGTLYLSIGSLYFSYLIYDVSDLYHYAWLRPFIKDGDICFNVFSGYSDGGIQLDKALKNIEIKHLDFFETGIAVTPSIIKAKELSAPLDNTIIHFNRWKNVEHANIILFMQSLHELRPLQQKIACISEAAAHLQEDGSIVIAEHLCDWKNFLIYGPGAFHFFGERHWKKAIQFSGLALTDQFRVTPFINVFVLKKTRL